MIIFLRLMVRGESIKKKHKKKKAEEEFLKKIKYAITEDKGKKEISIMPCNGIDITLHGITEAELFKESLQRSIQSVYGT